MRSALKTRIAARAQTHTHFHRCVTCAAYFRRWTNPVRPAPCGSHESQRTYPIICPGCRMK